MPDVKPDRDYDKLYAPLHRSILAGNLSGIAQRDNRFEYTTAGGEKFVLWPGSGLQKKNVSKQKEVHTDIEKTGLLHWVGVLNIRKQIQNSTRLKPP